MGSIADMACTRSVLQVDQGVEKVAEHRDVFGGRLVVFLVAEQIDGFFVDADAADGRILTLERGLQRACAVGIGSGHRRGLRDFIH